MDDIYQKIIEKYDKCPFPASISSKTHLIFLKYSSQKYRPYIINQFRLLCDKLHCKNKYEIFYLSLLYIDLILFNCKNEPIITNLNLLIFCCFYLSIKSRLSQFEILKIKDIKQLYPEKFDEFSKNDIREVEVLCLRLLDYNINFMTYYDFLLLIGERMKLSKTVINFSLDILNKTINNDIKNYIFKSPCKLAQDIIYSTRKKLIVIPKFNNSPDFTDRSKKIDNKFSKIFSPSLQEKSKEKDQKYVTISTNTSSKNMKVNQNNDLKLITISNNKYVSKLISPTKQEYDHKINNTQRGMCTSLEHINGNNKTNETDLFTFKQIETFKGTTYVNKSINEYFTNKNNNIDYSDRSPVNIIRKLKNNAIFKNINSKNNQRLMETKPKNIKNYAFLINANNNEIREKKCGKSLNLIETNPLNDSQKKKLNAHNAASLLNIGVKSRRALLLYNNKYFTKK